MNLLGALVLGSLVGYERAYHGRAAGMRTYGLVCMASAGLTIVCGYPGMWFGGMHAAASLPDPTRVMQGIVTGIGFLGAGVIVKEGLNISGLTTAASIWAASCIGVLIGVGFYAAAILLAMLCAATMMWGGRVEGWLPSHPAIHVRVRVRAGSTLRVADLGAALRRLGYQAAPGSFAFAGDDAGNEIRFVALAVCKREAAPLEELGRALGGHADVTDWTLGHARN
ncbi:MAG: MgtC/SapB family protein [Burkholderiales bacterium]|nr:MgtC/SapB family protein [Burkholderiales bacterium]